MGRMLDFLQSNQPKADSSMFAQAEITQYKNYKTVSSYDE